MASEQDRSLQHGIRQIESLAIDIKDLSARINIIALNSAIEAAHVALVVENLTETILNNLMLTQAWLVAELLKSERFRSNEAIEELGKTVDLPYIEVTDEDGVIIYATERQSIGWRFPDDPKEQAFAFRHLLTGQNRSVHQKLQRRSRDDAMFKYVGVQRLDQRGIVQIGLNADDINIHLGKTERVFSFISEDIRNLANGVAEKSRKIYNWIEGNQSLTGKSPDLSSSAFNQSLSEMNTIAGEVADLAEEIKLIAINSTIEAAHATLSLEELTDSLLNQLLVSQCKLAAQLFTIPQNVSNVYLNDLSRRTDLPNIYITDDDGVVRFTTEDAIMNWRFPDDPKAQAYPFRELITKPNHVVCQPLQTRTSNIDRFKFVGISRLDQPGIIQIGLQAGEIVQYQGETGKVFSVIANEISNLSGSLAKSAAALTDWVETASGKPDLA